MRVLNVARTGSRFGDTWPCRMSGDPAVRVESQPLSCSQEVELGMCDGTQHCGGKRLAVRKRPGWALSQIPVLDHLDPSLADHENTWKVI